MLPALQLTTVTKEGLVAELGNYQQGKLDFDLVVKYSEIRCLVYILSTHLQCKWSYMYHITFARRIQNGNLGEPTGNQPGTQRNTWGIIGEI